MKGRKIKTVMMREKDMVTERAKMMLMAKCVGDEREKTRVL